MLQINSQELFLGCLVFTNIVKMSYLHLKLNIWIKHILQLELFHATVIKQCAMFFTVTSVNNDPSLNKIILTIKSSYLW